MVDSKQDALLAFLKNPYWEGVYKNAPDLQLSMSSLSMNYMGSSMMMIGTTSLSIHRVTWASGDIGKLVSASVRRRMKTNNER